MEGRRARRRHRRAGLSPHLGLGGNPDPETILPGEDRDTGSAPAQGKNPLPGPAVPLDVAIGGIRTRIAQTIAGHGYGPGRPAFSPDGTRVVIGDLEGGLVVREVGSWKPLVRARVQRRTPHEKPAVNRLAWSPCGRYLAVSESGQLTLRSPETLEIIQAGPWGGLLAFGGGGTWLAVGSYNVTVLHVPGLERLRTYELNVDKWQYFGIRNLAADPESSFLAVDDDGGSSENGMGCSTGQGQSKVSLFQVPQVKAYAEILRDEYVIDLAFDRWRGQLVASEFHGSISAWNRGGRLVHRFAAHDRGGQIALSQPVIASLPSQTGLYSGSPSDYRLKIFAAAGRPGELVTEGVLPSTADASWIAGSPDGRWLLTYAGRSGDDFPIHAWEVYP